MYLNDCVLMLNWNIQYINYSDETKDFCILKFVISATAIADRCIKSSKYQWNLERMSCAEELSDGHGMLL